MVMAAEPKAGATAPAAAGGKVKVKMETSMGEMTLELDSAKAPKTVANFVQYARAGSYDGTIFHRVIRDFMIQGGGFTPDMNQKETKATIQNEADNGLKNLRGTIAMARRGDPHSASNQFFINTVDNPGLDFSAKTVQGWGYCVFGKVVDGLTAVDSIAAVRTGSSGMHQNVPLKPVTITKVSVVAR